MSRALSFALLTLAVISPAYAQDGPLRRAGRNIRATVENEVAREKISAQERDLLNRVTRRIEWDKKLVGSAMQVVTLPSGGVILKGSVLSPAAKLRAVDLVESTVGVTTVTDELAIMKEIKVIQAKPSARVVEIVPPVRVVEVVPPVVVPAESKVIVTP